MNNFFRKHTPLWAALGVWAAGMGILLTATVRRTGGVLIYGLDDAYIHLAISKHFLMGGVWGVTPYAFSSSSSSPVWPLLLAAGGRLLGSLGSLDLMPLILNLAASIFLIQYAYVIAGRLGWRGWKASALPLALAFLLPALPLAMIGMEALLFAALALAFAEAAVRYLLSPAEGGAWKMVIGALALTAVRYEGLFLVAVVCLLLLARRRLREAVWVGIFAVLPALLYAAVSLSLGWYALPNSLMIKHSPLAWNDPVSFWNLFTRIFLPIPDTLTVMIPRWNSMLYAAIILFVARTAGGERWSLWSRPVLSCIMFAGVAAMHGMLVAVEWQFRYEAYLMAIGIWALAALLAGWRFPGVRRAEAVAAIGLLLVLAYAPARGAVDGLIETPQASQNILDQQIQMGRFLQSQYDGKAVVVNDIGATDYLADLRLVDAYGLASMPVAEAKQAGSWEQTRTAILRQQAAVAGAEVAVLYDSWFHDGADIPQEWVRVESWTIRDNVVCGSDTVTWYAMNAANAEPLRNRLFAFHAQLPQTVAVREYDSK